MSTTANNTPITNLLAHYEQEGCNFDNLHFLVSASERYVQSMPDSQVRCLLHSLAQVVREQIPEKIVKPVLVENPNVTAWRPVVVAGLEDAVRVIRILLGHDQVTASTHIRRSVMKNGGIKAKLGIKFHAKTTYNRTHDYVKIIQRKINERMALNGLPFAAVLTTSGSQMNFNARVYLEGDGDYSTYVRMARI